MLFLVAVIPIVIYHIYVNTVAQQQGASKMTSKKTYYRLNDSDAVDTLYTCKGQTETILKAVLDGEDFDMARMQELIEKLQSVAAMAEKETEE